MVLKHEVFSINSVVPLISDDVVRPYWSVVIPTFNCAKYLVETLNSVLSQDPGADQMEIIVIDDHSTQDDPKAVVEEHGKGRVQFVRQPKNVGKSENYMSGIKLSKGYHIHLLHGDDTVNNDFYSKMKSLFESFPKATVGFCQCKYIDGKSQVIGQTNLLAKNKGILEGFILKIGVWQLIQPPSIVFKREVYETLGGYDRRLHYIEDWEFYVRSALVYKFAYLPEKLANYRIFPENSSSQSMKGGKRVSTVHQILGIMDSYLPKDIKEKIMDKRSQAAAIYLLNCIPKLVATKDFKGFTITTIAIFKYNKNLRLWGRWLRFIFQYKRFNL